MQFGAWIPLAELLAPPRPGAPAAPSGAGVFQLRLVEGLVTYPRGRSAMVAYGAGGDMQAALQALLRGPIGERAQRLGPLFCRFAAADAQRTPEQHLGRLHERFIAQFGSLPLAEVAAATPDATSDAAPDPLRER